MAQTTQHTPGPWEKFFYKGHETWMVRGGKGLTLAELANHETEDSEANARLIAAAPDLLEACQSLVAAYDGWDSVIPSVRAARAAAVKATQ